jgi:hypothetical protein
MVASGNCFSNYDFGNDGFCCVEVEEILVLIFADLL